MNRSAAALVFVAVIATAAGCAHRGAAGGRTRIASAPNAIPTAAARATTVHATTSISGIIAPLQNVAITSQLAEPADSVNVNEGDHVRAGQVIAVLDTADLVAQLAQAQATVQTDARNAASADAKVAQARYTQRLNIGQSSDQVRAAQAAVAQAEQTLANDTLTLSRDRQLLASGYIAQSQYDQQATQVKTDQQNVRSAQVTLQNDVSQVHANGTTSSGLQGAQVAAARADEQTALAQAQQVRVQISKARIVSPIDGVVVNRNLNPGEFPGTRQLFTLQETSRVYAVLNGSAAQIAGLHTGATATVVASSLPGKQFTGTVSGILNELTPGSTNFIAEVILANPTGILLPGMAVSGSAQLPATRGTMIPDTAFLDTTNATVQVVRGATVQTTKVTMLADDGKNAIVTGLTTGANVVVNGQAGLTDGQTVAPQEMAQR